MISPSKFKIRIKVGEEERWADANKVFAHLMKDYNKVQQKLQDNFEKRAGKFSDSIDEFADEYDAELLEDFEEYWTEPNKSGTKMKFELEKTWSLSRRLKKWKRNGFGKKQTIADFKPDTTGYSYMGYCEKCGVSDFYSKEGLRGDSKCHNAKLLPAKP